MQHKKQFKIKWWGWKADRMTGYYPMPRILWHLIWWLPIQITRFAFIATVFCANGFDSAEHAYSLSI